MFIVFREHPRLEGHRNTLGENSKEDRDNQDLKGT